MDRPNRTPEIAVALVVALVVAAGLVLDRTDEGSGGDDATAEVVESVPTVARRVERLRDVRFRRRPVPRVVDSETTRRESLGEVDRRYPERRRRADEEVVKLLGLVPPDFDVRDLQADLATDEIAGYYDPRRNRLAIVRDAAQGNRVLAEITLAHELVHALEDQRFGIDQEDPSADDGVSAYNALVEGTATAVMNDYASRYVRPGQALGAAAAALGAGGADLPEYVQAQIEFTYVQGERFVRELREVGNGWKLVDFALRRRAPETTEQVLHPEKYLALERPAVVRLRAGPLLGRGWRRATAGVLGEFDTVQLLERGDGARAGTAARGWGGGRYELWTDERRPARGCPPPCRRRDALVLAWRWDSPADSREFGPAVRAYVERGLHGRRAGPGRWAVGDGAVALVEDRGSTVLAFAPRAHLAGRLASGALSPR